MKTFLTVKHHYLILLFILLLALFLRFYKLGAIPMGLNQDETAIGYNAYSILKTGRDEYGTYMPLYFRSFDDYKLPVYIYSTAVVEKFLGMNAVAVRFTSAVFGFLSVIVLYFLVQLVSKRKDLALVSALFLASNPWHIFFSRIGSEVNVATSLALIGVFLFLEGIHQRSRISYLFLSLLSFGLSLYCYNVTRLIAPLLFILLVIYYRKSLKILPRGSFLLFFATFIIILIPFLLTLVSHSGLQNQQGTVLLTGTTFHAKALEFRSFMPHGLMIISRLIFNSWTFVLWQYLQNIVSFFSTNFYFVTGAANPINGIVNTGMFNLADFIFIITGLYMGIKKRERYLYYFYFWIATVILIGSITVEVPHPTRSYILIPPLVIFSAYGAVSLWEYIFSLKTKMRYVFGYGMLGIFVYSFLFYTVSYFFRFPILSAKQWRSEDKAVAAFIKENEKKYDKIVFDTRADYAYTSLLFYTQFPPEIYQKNATYQKAGLLSNLKDSGKYAFHQVDWKKEYDTSVKILFIASPNALPGYGVLKTFFYPTRPVVNVLNNRIISYPYDEPGYVAIETKSSYEK